jgi:dipeptidyl-peptidase 4
MFGRAAWRLKTKRRPETDDRGPRSFRTSPNTGGSGNAEYQDVVAGGKYLQSRADVDPNRVGIWGLSYGGVLTAQALARNSDIFKAGDRNVSFQQTTGLVQLLRQRDVDYELIVFPDDTHESMLHSRWMYTLERMDQFLKKFLGPDRKVVTDAGR